MAVSEDLARKTLLRRGFALEYVTLAWNVIGIVVLAFAAISARSVAHRRPGHHHRRDTSGCGPAGPHPQRGGRLVAGRPRRRVRAGLYAAREVRDIFFASRPGP